MRQIHAMAAFAILHATINTTSITIYANSTALRIVANTVKNAMSKTPRIRAKMAHVHIHANLAITFTTEHVRKTTPTTVERTERRAMQTSQMRRIRAQMACVLLHVIQIIISSKARAKPTQTNTVASMGKHAV